MGSEMCIRDSYTTTILRSFMKGRKEIRLRRLLLRLAYSFFYVVVAHAEASLRLTYVRRVVYIVIGLSIFQKRFIVPSMLIIESLAAAAAMFWLYERLILIFLFHFFC